MTETDQKKVYITMLGRSIWAVLNSYHAVLREKGFFPDEIVLFAEGKSCESLLKEITTTVRGLELLSEEFGISPEIGHQVISEYECEVGSDDDFVKMVQHIHELIKSRKKDGEQIAIDITPGKKTLVAGTLLPVNLSDVDHIFYLSIKEIVPRPYMMIPYQIQQLNDFKDQVVRAMNGQ
jgi:hypothetical protein